MRAVAFTAARASEVSPLACFQGLPTPWRGASSLPRPSGACRGPGAAICGGPPRSRPIGCGRWPGTSLAVDQVLQVPAHPHGCGRQACAVVLEGSKRKVLPTGRVGTASVRRPAQGLHFGSLSERGHLVVRQQLARRVAGLRAGRGLLGQRGGLVVGRKSPLLIHLLRGRLPKIVANCKDMILYPQSTGS